MTRAQCLVHKENKLLMVQHHYQGQTWWCLPGGGVEPGETPAEAALRELQEECCVRGVILRETSHWIYLTADDKTCTYLVDIGDQTPRLGSDPEFLSTDQVLVDLQWLSLSELPERDRAFLWAAGLLGIAAFEAELSGWGDEISYPRSSG